MSAAFSFAASLSGASVPCTPAQPFSGFGVPATAPLHSLHYQEPSAIDSVLLGAYDALLGTPAMSTDPASLFAPLDEIRSHEAAQADDLIMQLASTDLEFRQNLVHALVNHINPVLAYEPVGPMAPPTPTTMTPASLMFQALSDASASPPSLDPALLPWAASLEADAPFVDSLLALLGPLDATPATNVFQTPMLPAIAEEDDGSEDAPLSASLPATCDAPRGAKRPRDEDGEDDAERMAAGKMFYCDICNRGFSRQYNMRTHRRTHDPQSVAARPHACLHCPRSFTRKHDLERHQVLHDDSEAFKCTMCNRGFARLDVLERHANAVHKGAM
ncbi:hypothetical protein H4R19_001748 [Coemansia spiralis]|nr:hypothetical protein H4R19_001748 [Coemansia spiralis]